MCLRYLYQKIKEVTELIKKKKVKRESKIKVKKLKEKNKIKIKIKKGKINEALVLRKLLCKRVIL